MFKKSTSKNMLQNVLVFATLYCIGGRMFGKCLVSNVSFLSGKLIRVTLIKQAGISNEEMGKVKVFIFKQ